MPRILTGEGYAFHVDKIRTVRTLGGMDKVSAPSTAERIIGKFGGLSKLAKAMGHRNRTTVQGWKDRGVIPARQQPRVLEAAKQNEIELSPDDFFSGAA